MKRYSFGLGALLATLLSALVLAPAALAATPAGTVISNTATVNFEDINGNPLSRSSNTVSTTVSAVLGVAIAPPAAASSADPGEDACYAHTVSNLGNAPDTIDFDAISSEGWTITFYEDVNTNGTFESGTDTALTDTNADTRVDTGVLGGESSLDIIVCISVPAGTPDGTVDTMNMEVQSQADPTKTESATDTTTINAPALSVVKSVAPTGDQPPGTTLTYTIIITNSGDADAFNVILRDPVPANTTYVGESMTLNAAAQTDADDPPTDNADHDVTNSGEITIDLGTLASGGGSATVTFQVTID